MVGCNLGVALFYNGETARRSFIGIYSGARGICVHETRNWIVAYH